ncbi:hypothetical protein D3C76_1735620 [compost metagenome]
MSGFEFRNQLLDKRAVRRIDGVVGDRDLLGFAPGIAGVSSGVRTRTEIAGGFAAAAGGQDGG